MHGGSSWVADVRADVSVAYGAHDTYAASGACDRVALPCCSLTAHHSPDDGPARDGVNQISESDQIGSCQIEFERIPGIIRSDRIRDSPVELLGKTLVA